MARPGLACQGLAWPGLACTGVGLVWVLVWAWFGVGDGAGVGLVWAWCGFGAGVGLGVVWVWCCCLLGLVLGMVWGLVLVDAWLGLKSLSSEGLKSGVLTI